MLIFAELDNDIFYILKITTWYSESRYHKIRKELAKETDHRYKAEKRLTEILELMLQKDMIQQEQHTQLKDYELQFDVSTKIVRLNDLLFPLNRWIYPVLT